MNELISVIITTYNREDLLERAICPVIARLTVVELIIVDDCSNEKRRNSLNVYDQSVTRVLCISLMNVTRGTAALTSAATGVAALSHGVFVTGLDDDDYFLPGAFIKAGFALR